MSISTGLEGRITTGLASLTDGREREPIDDLLTRIFMGLSQTSRKSPTERGGKTIPFR